LLGRIFERESGVGAHALSQDVGHLRWQKRRRDYGPIRLHDSVVKRPGSIAPLLVQ
jgi:hypothetical protein